MPTEESSSEAAHIAEYLKANEERIVADWMRAVQDDDGIPAADRLTMQALEDHFPEMLAELIDAIQIDKPESTPTGARETARDHGKARWRDGYRLDELLRELGRIREIIIEHVNAFARDRASDTARDRAIRAIHRVFDTFIGASAQQFVDAQHSELTLRSTQLHQAHEVARVATDQLRAAAQSRLSLLRAVNHELRNALQPVTTAADLILKESEPSFRHDISSRLFTVASRLQLFLDRMRELSKLLAGEVQVQLAAVDLAEVLGDLIEMHRRSAQRKDLQLEKRLAMDIPEVSSDRDKLRQIGAELISNAIQFTDRGRVSVSMLEAEPDRWIFRVSDTGNGIDPADAEHLFHELHNPNPEPSARPRLGLVIARHLAHLLHGEITFQSTPGVGSTFDVIFPRAA